MLRIFEESFLNREKPLRVVEAHFAQINGITATVTLDLNGQRKVVTSVGNGRLDAVANAIQSATGMDFHLESYSEHSLTRAVPPARLPMWALPGAMAA